MAKKKKPKLELPQQLLNEIEAGNVVLMLGAGASYGATNDQGQHPPLAAELAKRIARRFLNPSYAERPLNFVSALAISQSDLFTFQQFIAETFQGFHPSQAHNKLTSFRWKGVATTNFDTLLEDAYRNSSSTSAQHLVPLIDNTDRPDDLLRGENSVAYLKLHGCVTRIKNENVPLILTTDQYNTHESGRNLVFNRLFDWAAQRPILFAGYSLQDANLLGLIQRVRREIPSPPRSYLVTVGIDDIQRTHWEQYRISAYDGTFEELAEVLDTQIGGLFRGLRPSSEVGNLAISDRFIKRDVTLSYNTTQFLQRDVDYVKSVIPEARIDPKQFYKGAESEWSAIDQGLDVTRHLTEEILLEHVLPDTANDADRPCFIVVKSHAGSGKSVMLRRLAWDAAREYNKLCLWIKADGVINSAAISDLVDQVKERIFLFVDNILDRRRELAALYDPRTSLGARITVIGAVRTNEWNGGHESLTSLATHVYELKYLSHKEIDVLIDKLETHKSLGTLERLDGEQRRAAFLERADRQLLVALHEATLGKRFEDIIEDEYRQITPYRAQLMYLTVCLLYQFNSPVRAGLISRLYSIPFTEFEQSFFRPLEQIITATYDKAAGDMVYKARHPHIAEMVVRTVLQTKDDLYNEYTKIIRYLNPSYNSDRSAFRRLVNGTTLCQNFTDHQMVMRIFEAAEQATGEDAYLLQQKCIYEMKRPSGNLAVAEGYIQKALEKSNKKHVLLHSLSELYVRRAEAATQPLDRRRYFEEAIKICNQIKSRRDDPFPYYTLLKIRTLQIADEIHSSESNDETIDFLIREAEKVLQTGLANHPDNASLSSAEADLATVLSAHERAIVAMERSFKQEERRAHIAVRLADHYQKQGKILGAADVLKRAIAAKPNDTRLHYLYAKLLMDHSSGDPDEICYYLRRSYSPGDKKVDARLLYGRQLFLMGKLDESKAVFDELHQHRMAPDSRTRLRYRGTEKYAGTVANIYANYCTIARSGDSASIYCNRDDLSRDEWNLLAKGCRVNFKLAFCMNGARAYGIERG